MESYLIDWLSLILRWLHVITGIAWIGASFYFIWLDNSLEDPPQCKKDKGIKGDLWAVHGGGIYEVAKYQGAPEVMPEHLHWFKWEAYSTWITGILLLAVIYYLGAESYLIDRRVADLSAAQAIGLGVLLVTGGALAWGLTALFSGRGAYIHFGAIIGTIMVGNVAMVIMPGQRKLVAALEAGTPIDPSWGAKAKLRSTHNTYLTLPLLFIMISNHYPMTYGHELNWLVLLIIVVITAISRQYFVLRHHGKQRPVILAGAVAATIALAAFIAPRPAPVSRVPSADPTALAARAQSIITERCSSCHGANPTDDVFTIAPGGVLLDSVEQMEQWAPRIKARSIDSQDMPFMNKTGMTDEERAIVAQWIALSGSGS